MVQVYRYNRNLFTGQWQIDKFKTFYSVRSVKRIVKNAIRKSKAMVKRNYYLGKNEINTDYKDYIDYRFIRYSEKKFEIRLELIATMYIIGVNCDPVLYEENLVHVPSEKFTYNPLDRLHYTENFLEMDYIDIE
jgi:hypothetical protein